MQTMVSCACILDERTRLQEISLSLNSFLLGHKCWALSQTLTPKTGNELGSFV